MHKPKLFLVLLMIGTIGIFTTRIPLSSGMIAFFRALCGAFFILAFIIIKRQRFNFAEIKRNSFLLLLSGTALGFNWVLLFEAFDRTGVAIGTLCYYMAPVFVILSSPFILKEKLTLKKLICTLCAVCGMVFVSGVFGGAELNTQGIGFGISAAVLYSLIIICNRKITGLAGLERSFCQLAVSAVIMCIYVLMTDDITAFFRLDGVSLLFLLIVGILHTGVFYTVYFSAMAALPAQTTAIISYTDPISSVLCGAIFLHESLDAYQIFGTVLILGSALVAEINLKKKQG